MDYGKLIFGGNEVLRIKCVDLGGYTLAVFIHFVLYFVSSPCMSHIRLSADFSLRICISPLIDDTLLDSRRVRWGNLSYRLGNDRCSSLVVLSLTNLATLFTMT